MKTQPVPANLSGKVVLITGASRGLGRVMALSLAEAGARVAAIARPGSEAKLDELIREAHGEIVPFTADVADADACTAVVQQVLARFGAVNVLFNNAAIGMVDLGPHVSRVVPFYEVPVDFWHRLMEVNVNGPFHMARCAVKGMLEQGWGRIVNLSTGLRTMVKVGFTPYGSSKAAIESMTAIWAQDLAGTGVTVNALLPGWVTDTDMVLKEDFPDRAKLVSPGVMIAPARWLASDASDGVTGMRIIGRDWDPALEPAQALKKAAAKAAW